MMKITNTRGANSCEVLLSLLCLKVACPGSVFLNRGNHEAEDVCTLNGFQAEVNRELF